MRLNSDFEDLLSALSRERVRYLVVGAYAVMQHTEPRYTKDLDILMAIEGVEFAAAWRARTRARWGRRVINVLSPAHLVANKRAVGRPQDLLDVQRLLPLVRRRKG